VACCDHVSLFGLPVGSGLFFRLIATVRLFSVDFRRARGICQIPQPRATFDSHSRILGVATLVRLPFRRYRFRGRHFAAPEFGVYDGRRYSLISSSNRVNPTLSKHPVLSLSERFGCHFLQLEVVPAGNYYRLLSLTRLQNPSGLAPRLSGFGPVLTSS
jgi:hypothetical protein